MVKIISDTEIHRTHFVDFDVVLEEGETAEDAAFKLAGDLLVNWIVLMKNGPGGGWPLIRFHGSRNELQVLIDRLQH